MEIARNRVHLGGISVERLVERFDSPLFVYEEDTLRDRARTLRWCFTWRDVALHFACKANTNLAIMRILRQEGCNIDAVSPGEVFLALKAGYKPSQILFTGNNVTDDEMRFVASKGVLINVDSLSQLDRYGKLFPGTPVSVRINPDVGAGHHDHCITGGPDSKFGVYFDKVADVKRLAKRHGLRIVGVHEHIGSGILETKTFLLAMRVLLDVARQFDSLEFVDFGGGIGVPYRPDQKPVGLTAFGRQVSALFADFCKSYGRDLQLKLEPGRFFVAESGFLLAKVNTVKCTPKHKFVGTDSGFNHLVRHTMYRSYHGILNGSNPNGRKELVVVAGNICESGDLFSHGREIAKVREGDVLVILTAGAYGFSMSSNYNSRPRPAEVLVKDGRAKVIREREALQDLLRRQLP
ncbi:MAG: diaminopimelate decarboxylase [Planctomycetes bacterium]|nr:diaminopimelate decarboxylase [Planctomycetota bacterium]